MLQRGRMDWISTLRGDCGKQVGKNIRLVKGGIWQPIWITRTGFSMGSCVHFIRYGLSASLDMKTFQPLMNPMIRIDMNRYLAKTN